MPGGLARAALWAPVWLACAAMIGCSGREVPVEPGVSRELARHRAGLISNLHYALRFDIPADIDEAIDATVDITFDLKDNRQPLQLDFRQEPGAVRALLSNGASTPYRFENEHLVVPPSALRAGTNTIHVAFTAGATSLNRNPDYLYTLFVPDRARTAFPLFDQPDLKAVFQLTLRLSPEWTALSNAPVASVSALDGGKEYRFADSDLISSYLFSFVAGRFETVTRERDGRTMTLLHRETDRKKVSRNIGAIFDLHAQAIDWLEDYTGIDYPFRKLDFALLPDFQYHGMEHVGAIQYRASHLFLEEAPTENQLLGRAGLIAHETAHMWFGNLVTMRWFDDVWTKEVFANFMAAKIVNPAFPGTDHALNFLVSHYPRAYSIDRTAGANPIRQELANLNGAGQLYGAIIYAKAPIMMRQLELLLGEERLREGLRDYLRAHAFSNATWPDLIRILDDRTDTDLERWSRVWVTGAGRPEFRVQSGEDGNLLLAQHDPAGNGRVWPQRFTARRLSKGIFPLLTIDSAATVTPLPDVPASAARALLFNADGIGYGLFPADLDLLGHWDILTPLERGSALVMLYERLLAGSVPEVEAYFAALLAILETEQNQLLLDLAMGQLARIHHSLLPEAAQVRQRPRLERVLWQRLVAETDSGRARLLFEGFAGLAGSPEAVSRLHALWSGEFAPDRLRLAEDDFIALAQTLAIRMPEAAGDIVAAQLARTLNPDNRRRLSFLAPSVAPQRRIRDAFFASLADPANRRTEVWVSEALRNLHHPARVAASEGYIQESLALLPELQVTGDIFFPTVWLHATLENHYSDRAVETVRGFLESHADLDPQLRMKILQAADIAFRANRIRASQEGGASSAPGTEREHG